MGKLKYLLFVLLGVLFLVCPQKVQAADTDVVINEVMVDPSTHDGKCSGDICEWIELYNTGQSPIDLNGWKIDEKIINSSLIIESNNYLIVTQNKNSFLQIWPMDSTRVYELSTMRLSNSSHDEIKIDNTIDYTEIFGWDKPAGEDISWEKINAEVNNDDNWHPSLVSGGTPGAKNSVSNLSEIHSPVLVSPTSGQSFFEGDDITFTWQNDDVGVTYEIMIATDISFSDPIIDEPNLLTKNYLAEDISIGTYYWKVITTNGVDEKESEVWTFQIAPIVYSSAILINELYPDPSGDSEAEWIELYNNSSENVNLKNWILEDLKGSIHQYKITNDIIIPAYGYIIINRANSGITLNNDQDGVRLRQPNNNLLYETPIFADGDKGWGFARKTDGTWTWTTTLTPAAENIITASVIEDAGGTDETDEEIDIPVNTDPIEIQTGEAANYENYLVTITGKVVSTSGNTFYLDDGSGKVKIYIQDATGIEKPEMHTGDIFEIIGIVNLYRDTWRILPQKQDDIRLIQAVQKDVEVKSSTTKKSTASTAAAKKTSTSSNATARSPTDKQIASANDIGSMKVEGAKSPWWVQLFKVLIGLSAIILTVLVIKVLKMRREYQPFGGNFGDET